MLAADVERLAALVLDDAHHARVAGEAPRRLGGDGRAVLELAATRSALLERIHINVHDDLLALAARERRGAVREIALGEHDERIGPPLRPVGLRRRIRFRGNVRQRQVLERGVERLHDEATGLGRQPRLDHDRAVLLVAPGKTAVSVLTRLALELGDFQHVAEVPHQLLDVARRAVQRHREQRRLGPGAGHPRQRPHLGVAQFPARHRRTDERQRLERVRHPHLLARRAQIQAALPVEPVRAALGEAAVPTQAAVELRDEREPAVGAGVQVPGELGDLVDQRRRRDGRESVARDSEGYLETAFARSDEVPSTGLLGL